MKVAIMQPYFSPYIGYFQLINAVDEFIVYDNIEYTKKGWFNRNRILVNGTDSFITLPLKKDSDFLYVKDRFLAENWIAEKKRILNRIKASYQKAPFFKMAYPVIEEAINFTDSNLFCFIYNTTKLVCNYLEIKSKIIISSSINIDHNLKSEDKVIALCRARNADIYINPIGGTHLYQAENFRDNNLELNFIQANPITYYQFENEFVPWLSIIDVMMFNAKDDIKTMLNQFELK